MGFGNRGKGLKILFFGIVHNFETKLVGCGDETNRCTAESRIRFCFVETSSTSLRSHEEFQGNFKDGWTKVVLVRAYFDATPLLHPFAFTIYPPQEDGCTVGKQKPRFSQWHFPIHHTGATDIIQYWTKGWAWTSSTAVDNSCGWLTYILLLRRMITILDHLLTYSVLSV